MKYLQTIILIGVYLTSRGYSCEMDSLHYVYYYKSHKNVFEVYKVDELGKIQLVNTLKLKSKRGRTFFISGIDTVYTLLAKKDIKVNPPSLLEDSLKNYDFDTPLEHGYINATFMCIIDQKCGIATNAIIYLGSSFADLDSRLLKRLKDIVVYWSPAKVGGKNVNSIIIGEYNFVTGTLKWLGDE